MRRTRHNANKDLKKSEMTTYTIQYSFTRITIWHQLLRIPPENDTKFRLLLLFFSILTILGVI